MKNLAKRQRPNSINPSKLKALRTAPSTALPIALKRLYRQLALWFLVGLFAFATLSSLVPSPSLARSSQTRASAPQSNPNPMLAFDTGGSFQGSGVALEHLLQQGQQHFKAGQFLKTISTLRTAVEQLQGQKNQQQFLARVLMNLGIVELTAGQAEAALEHWRQATALYDKLHLSNEASRARIYQTHALQMLGLNIHACETLLESAGLKHGYCQTIDRNRLEDKLLSILKQQPEQYRFLSLHSFSQILRTMGKLDAAELVSQAALKVAVSERDRSLAQLTHGNILRSWGNLERDRKSTAANYKDIPWHIKTRKIPPAAKTRYQEARIAYNQAIQNAVQPITRIQAQLNQLSLLLETLPPDKQKKYPGRQTKNPDRQKLETLKQLRQASQLWQPIDLAPLPDSHDKIYAQINLAKSLASLKQHAALQTTTTPAKSASHKTSKKTLQNIPEWDIIIALLETAVTDAKHLNDNRTISYAMGNLGGLYEYFGWLAVQHQQPDAAQKWQQQALETTQEALFKLQPMTTIATHIRDVTTIAPHITYQWQWQLGRLLNAQKNRKKAISAFGNSITTLKSVRDDLRAINTDAQFSFRDNIEPLYRQLVDLLLTPEAGSEPSPEDLKQAIQEMNALNLAELENFLRCDLSVTVEIDKKIDDPDVAVIYPIILENRLDTIVQLPSSKRLRYHSIPTPKAEVDRTLEDLRQELERDYLTDEGETAAKKVYNWIFQGEETALEKSNAKTLVFVLDGLFRNVPMAALQDSQGQYLIEKHAIAVTPGLKLKDTKDQKDKDSKTLFFGLSKMPKQFRDDFAPLPFVEKEANSIQQRSRSKVFLNEEFTRQGLEEKLRKLPASTFHFATHGEFSSNPDDTFILAWDNRIHTNELRDLLQKRNQNSTEALELLILSACKTADGDRRATLGLAGIAFQAGAHSTIASLWIINDEATAKFSEALYQQLTHSDKQITTAEALQQTQLNLLSEYKDEPVYWAPYILVGNWR